MAVDSISPSTARRIILACQGLDSSWRLPAGKEGVAQAIECLGYVQIDTIAVVERAHHHTLWCRCPGYAQPMLHELHAEDRRVFEYWAPAASYIPMSDYRYYLPRMRAYADRPRTREWLSAHAEVIERVRARIREEGPLGSADFKAPPGFERAGWWSWKPTKRALETLFSMGELMIAERRNFQRIYDLTERVLPPGTDTAEPTEGEMARFIVWRTLASQGVASGNDLVRGLTHWRAAIAQALADLIASGEVVALAIEGVEGGDHYAMAEALGIASSPAGGERPLHILSPFDSAVISRQRLQRLFGFDYALECYLPAAKRRYGYFCLPILWGERFVARMDAKADRRAGTFIVRRLVLEPDLDDYDSLLPALAERLRAFAAFHGCLQIVVEAAEPNGMRRALARALDIGPGEDCLMEGGM